MAPASEYRPTERANGHGRVVTPNADRRRLWTALLLLVGFMIIEVTIGLLAGSLALLSDAGHMLTDSMAIVLALVAIRLAARPARGRFTYGLKRAEILSAQANGITLLLLTAWFVVEGVRRLIDPPPVAGMLVFFTALAGIGVNIVATWFLRKANRASLNVEGAFQHVLNDLYAFIATAVAGAVVWLTGFQRADAIAALVVAALMAKAGWGLLRESGRILLEAAPAGLDPQEIRARLAGLPSVVHIDDLHIWQITSGEPAMSAHVLADPDANCHTVKANLLRMLRDEHGIDHATLQVDHAPAGPSTRELNAHGREFAPSS